MGSLLTGYHHLIHPVMDHPGLLHPVPLHAHLLHLAHHLLLVAPKMKSCQSIVQTRMKRTLLPWV